MNQKGGSSRVRTMPTPRAKRYGIVTTIHYRVTGEETWRAGILQNISTSGLLITAEGPLIKGTKMEMRFTLPVKLNDKPAADVLCRGFVVRSEEEVVSSGLVNIAAIISSSRLCRRSATI